MLKCIAATLIILLSLPTEGLLAQQKGKMTPQNPSPMIENTRPHQRINSEEISGETWNIDGILEHSIDLFLPETSKNTDSLSLLVHFHGLKSIANYAAISNPGWASITINLGSGSSAYSAPFTNPETFTNLIRTAKTKLNKPIKTIFISGWSAGYGAVRAILVSENYEIVDGALLLDGMHAGYIPQGVPLAAGSKINEEDLTAFEKLAKDAIKSNKTFLFTHSSVFPGTYASTTECADYLIQKLSLIQTPVLKEGPLGMQLLGEVSKGKLKILAFAGNTAPDHVDHLHGLFWFLDYMLE
ncbi:hypothetical protein [Echinicola arenosa]|uniref:hypothetical protein n=1 Tax=Echinicola arenosa TaxID=2774144 RepID=UPI001CDBF395|nr:hypothetical protein [Echinicola arenosa]